jgi:nucleoside-diphosphate-sugar epimerase
VDVVHHTAALVPLTKSGTRFHAVNAEGSRIVAEEAVRAGVSGFIHMSSSAVYGIPERCPITSSTTPRPIEPYGKAKLAGEAAVREACDGSGMIVLFIRPRTILGPGRMGIFQILFDWIGEGRNIYVIGSGNERFQFVHADDLVDAYMLLLDAGRSGTFNVGTDRFGTMREALEHLVAYAGSPSRVRSLPAWPAIRTLDMLDHLGVSPLAPWHYLTYHKAFHFDAAPLLEMGWKPRYSNDEMLAESYDLHRAERGAGITGGPEAVHRRPVSEKILRLVRKLS